MRFVWVDGRKRPFHRLIMEENSADLSGQTRSSVTRDGDLLNNEPANLIVVSREEHFELSMAAETKEPWTEDEKDDAVRLYCEAMTIDQVAHAIGRSYSATRRFLAGWRCCARPNDSCSAGLPPRLVSAKGGQGTG